MKDGWKKGRLPKMCFNGLHTYREEEVDDDDNDDDLHVTGK